MHVQNVPVEKKIIKKTANFNFVPHSGIFIHSPRRVGGVWVYLEKGAGGMMLLGCMAQKYSCFDPYWSCFGSGCDLGRNQHGPTAVKTLPRPYPALCQRGRGAAYSAMAGQQECSLQSSPFSGLLQPFPSLVVLALH